MSEKVLSELIESVREAGAIARGGREPSRVFEHHEATAAAMPAAPEMRFAICVETDDPQLLIPRKLYEVTLLPGEGRVRVTDEIGEAAIYPRSFFVLIDLPPEVRRELARVAS